ncbi:hypothetical protein GOC69_12190 [Sinorhizobium medicae]|nr:hypothetical protein [Sinorhizobium medicae]MDX0475205.1 hypothetical protein [Sinorhizobium medicae]
MTSVQEGADEPTHPGLRELFRYPLMSAIVDRRTRRVARGTSVQSGPISHTSTNKPSPLSSLEEAVLIVSTGLTGSTTMHDVPTKNANGEDRFSAPLINVLSRGASSIDNSHAVSFFMINDDGTWLIKQRRNREALTALAKLPPRWETWTEAHWLSAAESLKHKLYAERFDFPRRWPYFFIWNRQLSNRPGTTMLLPVVDLTRQFINVMISLLSEEDGERPLIVDDRRPFRPRNLIDWGVWLGSLLGIVPKIPYQIVGGAKRARGEWLNRDFPVPIGYYATLRTDYETFLLLQNLMLIAQGMGLGAWIHAAVDAPYIFERDPAQGKFGIPFRMQTPKKWWKWPPLPAPLDNPVGIDGVLESLSPPYVQSMGAAVDQVIEEKYGSAGTYGDSEIFDRAYKKAEYGDAFLKMASKRPKPEAVEYVKEICNYIYDTYGRFPAHANAFHFPGVWLQFSHLELEFYEKYFDESLYRRQAAHHEMWGN